MGANGKTEALSTPPGKPQTEMFIQYINPCAVTKSKTYYQQIDMRSKYKTMPEQAEAEVWGF